MPVQLNHALVVLVQGLLTELPSDLLTALAIAGVGAALRVLRGPRKGNPERNAIRKGSRRTRRAAVTRSCDGGARATGDAGPAYGNQAGACGGVDTETGVDESATTSSCSPRSNRASGAGGSPCA